MGVEIPAGIYGAIVLFIAVFGAIFGVWKYIDGKLTAVNTRVDAAANLAALARSNLADYKHEVAQTYATKDGMAKQTEQMLRAIEGVATRIDGISSRLDNILLQQQKPPTRRQS
jgi:uncharacterized membrane protein